MPSLLALGVRSFINAQTLNLRLYRRFSSSIDAALIAAGRADAVAAIHTLNGLLEQLKAINPPGPG